MTENPGPYGPTGDVSVLKVTRDGPYQLTGPATLVDHLGIAFDYTGAALLCRCGRSRTKPFCDGSHEASGFTGEKDPRRVPDQLDRYAGEQANISDNRGLCAHSGFCTDRLNGVFHLGREPFVTPSGGRLDEILTAVRKCPSGALGVSLNGAQGGALGDSERACRIEVSKDGPYRVTGAVLLVDDDGAPTARPAGASHEHYSLCRCGSSLNKPFCSGMHWSVEFTDPVRDPDLAPTLFEWAGGYPALLDLTRIFYGRHVPADPLIGPLFASMSPDHPERVAAWLSEVFGGPRFYSEQYGGYNRMISEHVGKGISEAQRARWAQLMAQSADEAGLPRDAEFRAAFTAYVEWGSRLAVENSQAGAHPPPNMPMPRWWWVCDATPDARVSALAPAASPQIMDAPALAPGEAPCFETHIKALFREVDRKSMRFAFDLWAEADVRLHGPAILDRLRAGTMPCDGAWPADRIALFEGWLGLVA